MSDILVAKGLHRTAIIPLSPKGEDWVIDNLEHHKVQPSVTINAEFTEDFIKSLQEAGLEVEVK